MKQKAIRSALLIINLLFLLVACAGPDPAIAPDAPDLEPAPTPAALPPTAQPALVFDPDVVTLHIRKSFDLINPDPLEDDFNMNINLLGWNIETIEPEPEAATQWEVSPDGRAYTFHLRDDIPWVRYDPAEGGVVQVMDEAGAPRFVTAADFVFAIKRICNPNIGGYWGSAVVAPEIEGCQALFDYEDPLSLPQELFENIGVTAVDDTTLRINLNASAGYLPSILSMFYMAAVPHWSVMEHGEDAWTDTGNLVTAGPYALAEQRLGERAVLVRNPLLPADMAGQGNIDRVEIALSLEEETAYEVWLNGELDMVSVPDAEQGGHESQFPEGIHFEINANMNILPRLSKPPLDNVHVRRALSAALDRKRLATEVPGARGLPMTHIAPPHIFGAPPLDEVGLGYDPDYAHAELEKAGYPNCEGFPPISMAAPRFLMPVMDFARTSWLATLGCDPEIFLLEEVTVSEMIDLLNVEMADADGVHIGALPWWPDYLDEHNYVGFYWCERESRILSRPCTEIDDLIVEARQESNPARRIELYYQIEEMFFGAEGEIPQIPAIVLTNMYARQTWLQVTQVNDWHNWVLDWEDKQGR